MWEMQRKINLELCIDISYIQCFPNRQVSNQKLLNIQFTFLLPS